MPSKRVDLGASALYIRIPPGNGGQRRGGGLTPKWRLLSGSISQVWTTISRDKQEHQRKFWSRTLKIGPQRERKEREEGTIFLFACKRC